MELYNILGDLKIDVVRDIIMFRMKKIYVYL